MEVEGGVPSSRNGWVRKKIWETKEGAFLITHLP